MDAIRLYLVWSSDDPNGLPLAEVVSRHFDNADEAREFGGIRIPVFVRYQGLSDASTVPRSIDLDEAQHNLVVVIGTRHLSDRIANELQWSKWFDDLSQAFARRGKNDRFVVLSLDANVMSMPGFAGRQAIRAFQWPFDLKSQNSLTRLLLLLTNRVGSILLEDGKHAAAGVPTRAPKQRLFISHAKLDGANDATSIRERLDKMDFGIEPFVDANDLTAGEEFTDELEAEIADATLLAVHTDAYGSRPFCRWEILRAKFHRRPIYIVHRLKQGESRVFPYGGNAPLMVVTDLDQDTIDRILLAAMTLVLRGMVWRRHADAVIAASGETGTLALARTPELVDLAHIKMRKDQAPPRLIVYPDPPLSDEERVLIPALGLDINVIALSELKAKI